MFDEALQRLVSCACHALSNAPKMERISMFSNHRVRFERPDIELLKKNHTVVDLHFHSQYSDGRNSVDQIVHRARELGIGISITDHNDIRGALELDRYNDVLTVPGIEITACEGSHLLVYFYEIDELRRFYERDVAPYRGPDVMSSLSLSMKQIIERARAFDSLIIFPHPYCALYTGICNPQFSEQELHDMLRRVDGVEVINAQNLKKWNLKCALLGFNLNKVMTGGSDGHALIHMGRAVTYARCPKRRRDLLNAVKKQSNQVMGKEIHLIRKVTANGFKLRSSLNHCPDLVEKHLRYSRKVINFKSRAIRSNVRRQIHKRLHSGTLRNYFSI
jgi:predicted metal-dependent phosphoesterase TrpH